MSVAAEGRFAEGPHLLRTEGGGQQWLCQGLRLPVHQLGQRLSLHVQAMHHQLPREAASPLRPSPDRKQQDLRVGEVVFDVRLLSPGSSDTASTNFVFSRVQLVQQFCPKVVRSIVQPYIKSYFARSEVLLPTMVASAGQAGRARAVHIITSRIQRGYERGSCLPRKLVVHRLNMEAQTLAELMNWEAEPLTEPLLTAALSSEKMRTLRETPLSCH